MREAVWGNGPVDKTGTAPRIDFTAHLDARLRAFIDTHDWITSFPLPSYSPDVNPVEGIWSLIRRTGLGNTAFTDPDHLIRVLRRRLRELQYRPDLSDGYLAGTGLAGARYRLVFL
ncbi:transposase, partial [Streptomyces spectabilis]